MLSRETLEFLGLWETLHNPEFKPVEFDGFRKEAGLHAFTMSPSKWIKSVNAIGITTKAGRYFDAVVDLAKMEVLHHNKRDLERMLENESHQRNRDIRRKKNDPIL